MPYYICHHCFHSWSIRSTLSQVWWMLEWSKDPEIYNTVDEMAKGSIWSWAPRLNFTNSPLLCSYQTFGFYHNSRCVDAQYALIIEPDAPNVWWFRIPPWRIEAAVCLQCRKISCSQSCWKIWLRLGIVKTRHARNLNSSYHCIRENTLFTNIS